MRRKLLLIPSLTLALILGFMLGSSTKANTLAAGLGDLLVFPYVDEAAFEDGPHWMLRVVWPSGVTLFAFDPEPIRVSSSSDAASLFPGTSANEWHPLQEGSRTIWIFHSGSPKALTPLFGTLDIGRNVGPGQTVTVADATWRFGPENPQASVPEATVPSKPGDPSSALGGQWQFVSGNQWKLVGGTHTIHGSQGWVVHTPRFPGDPGLPPGQTEETNIATAYKQ